MLNFSYISHRAYKYAKEISDYLVGTKARKGLVQGNKMFAIKTFLIVYSLFAIGDAKFGDNLKKCSIKDDECLKSVYQGIVKDIAKSGIPDLNMPPLDPLKVSNVVVNIFDTVTGTLVDGELKGIENCVFNKFQIDVQKKITTQHITCDIAIQGTIKLAGKNPAMQAVLGTSSVDAFGKGGFKMEKISLKFEAPFSLYKKDDGKIYLKVDDKAVKYLYDIKDAHFWADKITIGNEDISKIGVEYMNKNWRVIMKTFGTLFVDTSVPMYFGLANQFYGAFPMNSYIVEDMSSYVK